MLRRKSLLMLSVAVTVVAGTLAALIAVASNEDAVIGRDIASVTIKTAMFPDKPIQVVAAKRSVFAITVPSNMTTGYSWRLSKPITGAVVQQVSNKYNAPAEAVPGRGGTETWTFIAAEKGKATITLEYARPWEKDVKPIKTQTFSVTVN